MLQTGKMTGKGGIFYGISASILLFNQAVIGKNIYPLESYEPLFQEWMMQYSLTIPDTEYNMRLQIFADTHDIIETHNSGFLKPLFSV